MLEAVDRVEEMHDFLTAENHRQLNGVRFIITGTPSKQAAV
jgi:hypothetical protein